MTVVRTLLAPLLAVLLFVQRVGGPAHCLHAAHGMDPAICTTTPAPSAPDTTLSRDHTCPACHALAATILPPPSEAVPVSIVWTILALPDPPHGATPVPPPALPLQPRAPPPSA